MPGSASEQQLTSLHTMNKAELSGLWKQFFDKDPSPDIRRELVVRMIAYRLQEQDGGLTDSSRRRLRQLARTFEDNPNATVSSRLPIKPGTRLVREWKQQVHVVEVEAIGYQYKGCRYESLSEIARLITGTRWSGPLFFGLKNKPGVAPREVR
jgi:hypothetical protein